MKVNFVTTLTSIPLRCWSHFEPQKMKKISPCLFYFTITENYFWSKVSLHFFALFLFTFGFAQHFYIIFLVSVVANQFQWGYDWDHKTCKCWTIHRHDTIEKFVAIQNISKKKSQTYMVFRIEITPDFRSVNYFVSSEYKIANNIAKYSKWR